MTSERVAGDLCQPWALATVSGPGVSFQYQQFSCNLIIGNHIPIGKKVMVRGLSQSVINLLCAEKIVLLHRNKWAKKSSLI